ncbi:helicase HerA domain-containing protein [Thermoguttaceae bacterium LCP21S3_D4]
MGVKNVIKKVGDKAGNKVAKLAALSSGQVEEIQLQREKYLLEKPEPSDELAIDTTWRMMAASSVEIFNAYLPQIKELYLPIEKSAEYEEVFSPDHNIRYFNITKWVQDKKENSLEKLVNVYAVLSNEDCNIALVFNRTQEGTNVYLAVVNTANADNNVNTNSYKNRLLEAIRGNFPGAEWGEEGIGIIPCMNNERPYSVATASNIPTEKSDKFISQTIEKLLDGIIPTDKKKEYTIVLLATPIKDVEQRKLKLSEFYSGLKPYAEWQTNFTYTESNAIGSSATVGVNVGASAGIQNGTSNAVTDSDSETENESRTDTQSQSDTLSRSEAIAGSESSTHTEGASVTDTITEGSSDTAGVNASQSVGVNSSATATAGGGIVPASASATVGTSATTTVGASYQHGWNRSNAQALGKTASDALTKGITNTVSNSVAKTTGTAVANTLGKAVTKAMATTSAVTKGTSLGANFGANFARSSTVTAMIGKNEGITQTFTNFNIKHALDLLENQMERLEQSTALGMWDFAAYVLSEEYDVANNVAHSYLALTLGEDSYMSKSAINVWKGNVEEEKAVAKEIAGYIRELRHPLFGLKQDIIIEDRAFNVYPSVVTATTSLSGKELAYSLNFPQKSIAGLPIIECAEFGRNVVTYDLTTENTEQIEVGNIFHMNHIEENRVDLAKKSLASHTFITGSTGSGKSNTVYQMLEKARKKNVKFLVVEPAKGEYKHVFGIYKDVSVFGTNPALTPILRINPFSFPNGVHVLEHLDRLVEIFNVCWPMYAAMPAVLKSAVEKSYKDCGWDMIRSINIYGEELYPTFADVAKNIKEIIDNSEFDNDNKGAYKGSLLTRLESLTNGINGMIFTCNEISNEALFDENVIVDLSRVGSSETKSLIMGMLVLKLQEYRMTSNAMNVELGHITVLEEAHNLLKRTSTEQSSESGNLISKSVEMLTNAIAEMRTYGEGFIIADQAPGLLDMAVIRNTNTKIIMRLPDQTDRELVGRAANLNADQITELAKLPCGVAAIYQNEWVQPVLCKIDKHKTPNKEYENKSEKDVYLDAYAQKVSDSLLDCIMNKELFRKGNKADIKKLKGMVIKSKLSTEIKRDFVEYLSSDDENTLETLRVLIFDFLSAENAIKESRHCEDINAWVRSVVDALKPSVKEYTNHQIDLVLALILYEQTTRDPEYDGVFGRFTEVYQNEGGVY